MITISAIVSALGLVATNLPAFMALGADVVNMFDKGKALVSSDTASTPEERASALASIEDMQAQFAVRLAELRTQAPNS